MASSRTAESAKVASEPTAGAAQRPETKRWAPAGWLLLALLLLALCIGVGLGAGLSRYFSPPQAAPAPPRYCPEGHAGAVASTSLAPEEPEQPAAAVAPARPSDSAEKASRRALTVPPKPRAVSTARARADAGAPPAALGPDLKEALKLLRAAQRALRVDDAPGALSQLDQMARRVPHALVEEREVTRALAHCSAGDVESARRTAAALRESGTASVYAHRLAKSCVGPAPAPSELVDEMRRRVPN